MDGYILLITIAQELDRGNVESVHCSKVEVFFPLTKNCSFVPWEA